MIPFSVLDLAPIAEGSDAAAALRHSADLARHAESLGYRRFWLAEHHNMPGIASAATAVVIAHVAAATTTIRVGAGGIMLPNHAPLVIAEQFGTLAALFPDRIDLGLGRAPGTDQATARALRRYAEAADEFPGDVAELLGYLGEPRGPVRAIPGAGSHVPVWVLGSSLFGAELAARLGLRYAFASHFAPAQVREALALYRRSFRPSSSLRAPYAMIGLHVVAADDDRTAQRLFTSVQQQFLRLRFATPGKLPPPVDELGDQWSEAELALVERALELAVVGDPATVRDRLAAIIGDLAPDEVIVTAQIHDHRARLRSFELVAQAQAALAAR